MRPLVIHRSSFLLGLAIAAVGFLVAAQSTPPPGPPRIEYGPHPRDMVQVAQGVPYVVPAGKLFVLTGLGGAENGGYCTLSVDGIIQASVCNSCTTAPGSQISAVPPGFTVVAGATITVFTNSGGASARAWGYLASAS